MSLYPNRPVVVDLPEEYRPAIDELPGDLVWIARAIEDELPGMGVRVALIMGQKLAGAEPHIHNVRKIIARYWEDRLRAEYDAGGATAQSLGLKYGISKRHAEKILAKPSQDLLKSKQLLLF